MILEAVELRNFKSYRGVHRLVLPRPTDKRRVYLIGGLNGSGKTSLVHALMLAMLGREAASLPGMFTSGRGKRRNYENWLSASLNKEASRAGEDHMSVAVELTTDEGDRLRIARSWWFSATGDVVEEGISVVPLGETDADRAAEGDAAEADIRQVFPRYLAEFLFFDGEDVRVVEPDGVTLRVESALDRLLGLDAATQLVTDLDRAIRLRQASLATTGQLEALASLQRRCEAAAATLAPLVAQRHEAALALSEARQHLARLEDATSANAHGDQPLTVTQIHHQREDLLKRRTLLRQRFGRYLGDWLYLEPVAKEVERLRALAEKETGIREEGRSRKLQLEAVEAFAESLLKSVPHPVKGDVVPAIRQLLQAEVKRCAVQNPLAALSGLSEPELRLIQEGAAHLQARDRADAHDVACELAAVDASLERLEAMSAEFQNSSGLERLVTQRYEVQAAVLDLERVLAAATDQAELAQEERRAAQLALRRVEQRLSGQDEITRWLDQAEALRRSVTAYAADRRNAALSRLEQALLGALKNLFRRQQMIKSVEVLPDTYDIRVRDRNDELLRMPSAGEHQLLALAFTQALLTLAEHRVPFFIDTPLGRLDSIHRRGVVSRFLPVAAPQVLVFSTDEEVVGELQEALAPHVACNFLLSHDDGSDSSQIIPNAYFEGTE